MFTKKLKQEGLRKTAAVFTAISFMLSIFTSGGFAAPSQMPMRAQSAKIAPALPADYIVPFNIGRVTDAVNYKSDKVIVQIQDLHSHEETQRNIAGIISFLDSKYKIGNIYVEGAVGDIDTSWLAGIEDEAVKTSVIDSLLAKGVLTGAEYYSAVSGKTKVLKGMEDKDAYLENFRRLIRINSSKDEIKAAFPEIKEMFAFLSDKYYSKENKKIDETVRKYREGKISFERYFAYIVKKARDKNVYFGFYPALIAFSNIIKVQSRLNKKKINAQMTAFMDELKEKVSFSEYKEIVSNFGKPETEAIFYFKLAEAYEKYGYNGKYGELAEFLRFINLNQHINPLDLVREEKELLREVREKYSVSGVERDLLFISDFLGLMESFLNNKITAAEYKYFERELPRFKTLWAQYTLVSGLPSLDGYYSLFEGFYSLNLARNNIFVDNVTESKGGKNSGELASFDKNSVSGISAMINAAKELDIVVAGGFHTQDISRILQSSKQSYVVVTPNVTRDASAADRLFNEDIIRISKFIPANAYQKAIASARLNFIDDADKSQILNAVVGTYISKEVLDAALSALDEQTRDAAAADPRLLADIVKNEIIANIAGQLEQKGISDFNVAGIEIAENGYKVTAGSRETGQKTFNVDEEGASDSGQIQPFSVPTANNIVKTVRLASLLMSFGAAGMFFAAAPVVIPVSLAAASLIFGAFGISLKKSSAAVSKAQRQAKSSEPLTEAQAAQLKENIKNAIRNYVGEEKYDRLGVEIYDTAGSDDIAHVSTSRTATGKTIVLEIDLLAFSKLLDNDKTQAERILTHEARHILGHGEAGAYLANLLPKPLVKFYNAGKNRAYAEFYSSLNAMKALQETNAGFETRRKTARNLIDAAAGLMAFMKNGTLAHSERRKILKLISEAVNVLKAGNINELAGAETVENEATGSSSVEPASSGLAEGYNLLVSAVRTAFVKVSDNAGVDRIADEALEGAGIEKGSINESFFKNLIKKLLEKRSGAQQAESLTMGFEDSEEAANRSKANFFGSAAAQWVREKMGAVSLKSIISDKRNAAAAERVDFVSYPLNGGIGSSLERKAYVAAVRKYLSELDAARKAQDAAKIADLKARMKSGEYLSGVSDSEIKNAQLGAKASDLYFEVNGELKSVSELKMERMLIERDLGIYADVTMKMLVSSETRESVEELFNRESMKYAGRTYKELFKGIEMLEQAAYPVVCEKNGEIAFVMSDVAPGGHGYWGYYLLKALLSRTDAATGAVAIGVVSNEDGLNNKIPAELAGFMAREKIGIVMLSTTATDLDKKSGKIGVIKRNGRYVTGMMEAAQAESAGQTKEFQELGLTIGERGEQFFNTNTVLLNASILAPMLRELADIIGEEEFEKVIMPDLIENKDKKTGNIKLEGAIGSVMLNLNAFFETTDNEEVKALKRKYVGEGQLVRIVNAEEELRSSVFTPVKKAIDIWFQEESGYYKFNPDTYELEEATANSVPAFSLEGKDYEDIKYLKKNWTNVDAKDIKSLTVKGEGVKFKNAVLAGDVRVINESGEDIVISQETLGPEFASDAGGRIIIQDMEIVVGKDGRVKVRDSAGTAAGKSFLRRIAGALLKFLAGLVNRDTFVFKEAPGMLGRTYTIVLSDFSPDSINAVSKRAAEIARLGINVNVIAPMNDNITDFTALGLISGEETGLRNLFTRKDKIENGREVNYYYYSRKTAAEFSSVKGDDKTDWANETLKWLRSRAVSEDDFGVIEVGLSSELSFEQVNALFPEAYIAASVRQNEDLKFAESKGFIQTVRPGTEKNAVIEAGERFRFLKQGGDMRTSPLFSTVIDVSGTDITDAAFADALLDMDLDTAVLKVNAAVLTQDTVNAIKQFMLSAQEKGLKTVIEFKAENEREALSLLTDIGSLLSQLRVNSRGVDGVRLDFNSLAGREMENVLTQSNLKSLRLAVNRENADGIIGIKAEDAGRSIEVNNALIMRLSALNIRNVITVETKSDITDAGQAWLDFSTGGKMYNKQTADALQIAGNIESALEAQAAVLGLDWEIISAMKNTAEGVNIAGMIKNIVRKKLSFFKATPAGRYDAGRKFALSKSDIGFKAGQEVSLYRLLNDMRNAEKADAVLVSKLFEIFPNAKTKQLGEAAASSDAEKISLVFEEAKGYLQGILERSQSDIHIRATEFKVRTDADIYRAALVEARLYTVINNADIDAVQEVPYSSQLRDNKAYTDEKDAAVNAELARARELVGSVLARAESESIVALQPEVREAVNILTSLTEGKTLSSSANKAMAVADLLAMLALYADKVEKTAIEKGRDNLASMQEGVRAMLSAA